MKASEIIKCIQQGKVSSKLLEIYVDEQKIHQQEIRYIDALNHFMSLHGNQDVEVYSVPGRSEVGGNHTDHQHGQVLATAVNLDMIGIVSRQEKTIKIVSDHYDLKPIDLNELGKSEEDIGTSEGLIKGVSSRLQELGYHIGGFNGYFTSDVLMGSGLSSSAAFEVMIGTIQSGLYNDMSIDPVVLAQVGQYAENHYFGKPCGLMDQVACSVGGLVHIDFANIKEPVVKPLKIEFQQFGHSICIVDTKGSHADLTDDYAAIPYEMKAIAHHFNEEYLNDVNEEEFYEKINELRLILSDRAILRAIHYFEENKRVQKEVNALLCGEFNLFKYVFCESGNSSFQYLQNVYTNSSVDVQGVSIAIALSKKIHGYHGVTRVHGGGFAGTIQAIIEDSYVNTYKEQMEKYFGEGSCYILKIRNTGGVKII